MVVKGLAEAIHAWQVLGPSSVQSRFEAQHESTLTPLVAREEELELLLRRWQDAARGSGRVVLLSGEPGIGKSRLIAALQEGLHSESHSEPLLRLLLATTHRYRTVSCHQSDSTSGETRRR